jgi:hypothetical protein
MLLLLIYQQVGNQEEELHRKNKQMKKFGVIILLINSLYCFGQNDTTIVKKQKGFLFLSEYNYLYDYDGGHIRPLGFHDFFFPSDCINVKCFLDSNINIVFRKGLRIDSISKNRKLLKGKASLFLSIDTSGCYRYDKFYVIPVEIDYLLFEDYEPYVCRRNYFELQVKNGSKLRFEYLHKAILPRRIIPTLPPVEKKKSK